MIFVHDVCVGKLKQNLVFSYTCDKKDSKLGLDATNQSTICSTLKQPIIPKDRIELNESSSFSSHEPLGSDLMVSSGTISHAGN